MAIHTPDQRLRVFVSSTLGELAPERAAVRKTIEGLHLIPVMFELGASPHPPRDLYRAYLAQSQVFIGMYWQRYGWVAPGMDVSGLEDEYLLSSDMPRLIYIKSPAPEREPGLAEMLNRIENEGSASYKKFSTPEELGELIASDLAVMLSERFERSPAGDSPAEDLLVRKITNLPTELTPFIGRAGQLADVCSLFEKDIFHLVTLTGPGGVGKTRLAIRVATCLLDHFPDGAWLVELAPLADPNLIAQSIANTIGVREEKNQPIRLTLLDYLSNRSLLLVLDNSEHLIRAVAELTELLLHNAPKLRILATSREALGVAGEAVCTIPPLSTPKPRDNPPLDKLNQYEAVQLFLARAAAVQPSFVLTEQNSTAVAQICTRLDGIPLAIELAAARLRALSPQEIARRLEDSFSLLVGNRTAAPRQQTLSALIDWSYNLLAENERILLRRLAVFNGGWTLPAAEVVCQGGRIDQGDVLDQLSGLIDKSLVIVEPHEDHNRYRFLETIRKFSLAHLAASGEAVETAQKQAKYFADLAMQSCAELSSLQQLAQLARLDEEFDNIRAALEWLRGDENQVELFLRTVVVLTRFWEIRGVFSEGRGWIESALAVCPDAPARLRANGLRGVGILAAKHGDYGKAQAMHEQSLALFRELDYKPGIAAELDELGELMHVKGDYEQAVDLYNESLALRYETGDKEGMIDSIGHLGMLAREQGRYPLAKDLLEHGLTLSRELEDKLITAQSLKNLGLVAFYRCQYRQARQLFEEALSLYRILNDRSGISETLQNLGNVARDQGEFKLAKDYYGECLEIQKTLGDRQGSAQATSSLAEVAFHQGYYPRAADLADTGLELFRGLGVKRGVIYSLGIRAFVAHYQGDFAAAHALANECLSLAQEITTPRPIAYSKEVFGLEAYTEGDYDGAARLFREAMAIFQKIGDRRSVASAWVNLARTAYRQGNPDCAMHYLNDSMSISYSLEIQWTISYALEIMGLLQRSLGRLERAQALFLESLQLSVKQDNQQGIANCLGALAGIAVQQQQPVQAARLFAHTDMIRQSVGAWMGKDDWEEYERRLAMARGQMDSAGFIAASEAGRTMTTEQILQEVQDWSGNIFIRQIPVQ